MRRTVKRDLARRPLARRSGFTGRINGTSTSGAHIWRLSNVGLEVFPTCGYNLSRPTDEHIAGYATRTLGSVIAI